MTELVSKSLVIRSSAFENNMAIHSKYTADGDNINPPLTIENLPNNTQSLALTIEDLIRLQEVLFIGLCGIFRHQMKYKNTLPLGLRSK